VSSYLIPILAENQTFTTSLNNVNYTFTIVWNAKTNTWDMSLVVTKTKERILSSIPLVPGTNLLEQFKYLGFGLSLITDLPSNLVYQPI
jgi:hypothetical protein